MKAFSRETTKAFDRIPLRGLLANSKASLTWAPLHFTLRKHDVHFSKLHRQSAREPPETSRKFSWSFALHCLHCFVLHIIGKGTPSLFSADVKIILTL